MGELEDRINSVLGDPEQMEKITKLAKSFMAGKQSGESGAETDGDIGGLGSLLSTLNPGGEAPDFDPKILSRIGKLLKNSAPEKKQEQALFEAMKPYLSEKRRNKMDKAIRIARIAGIAKAVMGEMGGDGAD